MTVRTRIAPSPTGDPHVGTAYIALFNLCFARQHKGQFILRIEDTDQVRSTPESEKAILDSMRWVGLEWDEGPDVGGDFGPYRQSERMDIYKKYVDELLEKGHAFHCFRTPAELDQLREEKRAKGEMPGFKLENPALPAEEVERRIAAGESYVVRMKVPMDGICEVKDLLRSTVEIPWEQVDMQVLLKSDGMPTYHLANVVDDHLMAITHVIRGEEWINSAPKHILLYQYFGWNEPVFCHMPLLRNPDKSKLSKRKNPTSITYYERMGFLPEAMLNYLGRMGWSMPDEREKFSLAEMIERFDIQRVSLGGPIFDVEKLKWLNGNWLREDLTPEALAERIQQWAFNKDNLMRMLPDIQKRIEVMSDIAPLASFFLSGMLDLDEASFTHKKLELAEVKKALQFGLWKLEALRVWDETAITEALTSLAEKLEIKLRDFIAPYFVAISGKSSSTPVFSAMAILGPDMTRARLRHAVTILGGVSKKETKRWEKEFKKL
ncbi:MAG: glutamate--tRNA ligase [Pseudomonadales bacterium]|nr:glutamate--tRNA ligase [Pseudomonadales bacterium]